MGFKDDVGDDHQGQGGRIHHNHVKQGADCNNCGLEDPYSEDDDDDDDVNLKRDKDDDDDDSLKRDSNNNSSSTLFSEAEIPGRGRGMVAKVKLIIITILNSHHIHIYKVRLPAGTLVAREAPIFTLVHPALLKVGMVKIGKMDVRALPF